MTDHNARTERQELYQAIKRQEAKDRWNRMVEKHGPLWLDFLSTTHDDAVGIVIQTRGDTVRVQLYKNATVVGFNALDWYAIPAKDLWLGDLVRKVPA